MSSVIASVLRNRPTVVARLTFLLLLPWVWTAYFLPPWALSVCGGLSLIAFFAGLRSFVTPMFARRRSDDPKLSVDQVVKMRAGDAGKPGFDIRTIQGELGQFQRQLNIWGGTSKTSSSKTADAREGMGEVISQTEQAVLALTMSFRGITTKTRQQMETAMSLLRRNASELTVSEGAWLSLPDYIRAYETQLNEVTDSMIKFSTASDEMVTHQGRIREQSIIIDELLDELRSMSIHIGRLALDSSVAAGESGPNREVLVKLTDSIRETSDQAHGLTRTVRQSLEKIRDELVVTYKIINKAGGIAKVSAQRAKADVSQLNVTMIEKTKEIEASLGKINSLGLDIQQDVNNAIIAMQFQDITQQKLEYMRGSILGDVMQNLDLLSVETQEMMKKDLFLAIRAEAERMNASSGPLMKSASVAEQSAWCESELVEVSDASGPDGTPVTEKVTLF
jgi:methyl-accepting chemotaxis protein